MCFNKESSIISYVLTNVLSLILFNYGDKYDKTIAIFSIIFIQIQLAEFFMWSDQNCNEMNHFATIYAHIFLLLQPFAILIPALIYKTTYIPNNIIYFCIILASIPLIESIIINFKNKRQLCSKKQETKYLEWDFVNGNSETWSVFTIIIYYIIIFVPWLFLKNHFKGNLLFLILIITFLSSIFGDTKSIFFKQFESKWCYMTVLVPIVFLFIKIPFIKNLGFKI